MAERLRAAGSPAASAVEAPQEAASPAFRANGPAASAVEAPQEAASPAFRANGPAASAVEAPQEAASPAFRANGRASPSSAAKESASNGSTPAPYRIAVFASGSGSNFQAIADAARAGRLDAGIELLVCDRPHAPVVERAQAAGIDVLAFRPKEYGSREEYERMILTELQRRGIELIALAGYMRIITPVLVEPYCGRMINIHPSLLPSFPGVDAIDQALAHGVKVTGVTVHFVDGGMDTGPIIAQRTVDVREDDTADTLAARIHAVEHELYPETIRLIRDKRVTLLDDGRKVRIQ